MDGYQTTLAVIAALAALAIIGTVMYRLRRNYHQRHKTFELRVVPAPTEATDDVRKLLVFDLEPGAFTAPRLALIVTGSAAQMRSRVDVVLAELRRKIDAQLKKIETGDFSSVSLSVRPSEPAVLTDLSELRLWAAAAEQATANYVECNCGMSGGEVAKPICYGTCTYGMLLKAGEQIRSKITALLQAKVNAYRPPAVPRPFVGGLKKL